MSTLAINFSPLLQRYTLEELWELPEREDGAHYNLIAGFLFLVPRPDPPHGDVVSWMCTLLIKFIITNNIAGELWLVDPFGATIEVRHASKAGEILMWRAIEYSHGQHAKSHVLEGFQVLLMN